MAEAKEMLRRAKLVEKGLEKTAKRIGTLPVRLVRGKDPAAAEDIPLLEKIDAGLKTLQQAGSSITKNLNEVELSLLQLRHSQRLRKQARRNISLAEKRAEQAAAEQARKEKKAAAKARKAAERAAKLQAREAKKGRKAQKKAAEKAARQAKKDAEKRARKERKLQKKGRGAASGGEASVRSVAVGPVGSASGTGLLGGPQSN